MTETVNKAPLLNASPFRAKIQHQINNIVPPLQIHRQPMSCVIPCELFMCILKRMQGLSTV